MLLFFFSFVLSTFASTEKMSYPDLEQLIQDNKVVHLDQLIPLLPPEMKRKSVLVYDSHALHLERITPLRPRIMLFNSDGSLVMTMTQNPGSELIHAGQDQLEIISYNKLTDQFEMRSLPFNGRDVPGKKEKIEVNPALCLNCHGSSPRPIFEGYNTWSGFYGSFSYEGLSAKGSQEFTWLKEFLEDRKSQPRYADLDLSGFYPDEKGIVYRPSGNTAAMDLGKGFEQLMIQRLARKLISSPAYKSIRPLLEYLGSDIDSASNSDSLTCMDRANRSLSLYKEWMQLQSPEQEKALLTRLTNQFQKDQDFKVTTFEKFNHTVNGSYGVAHVASVPYSVWTGYHSYIELSPHFYQTYIVFLESLLQHTDFKSSDISTFPNAVTLGLHHVPSVESVSVFQGLALALGQKDPQFQKVLKDCKSSHDQALAILKGIPLPDPTQPGVLYR